MQEPTDAQLVSALILGDQAALGVLYDRHAAVMCGVAARILDNVNDAEDLVHDVFVEAWQSAQQFDQARGSVRSWLLIRLRSRALDRRRSLAVARRKQVLLTQDAEHIEEDQMATEALATRAQALRLLNGLDPAQRQVVELAYLQGLASPDIAARCNIPIGTVKSRMSRALAKLRDGLLHAQEAPL